MSANGNYGESRPRAPVFNPPTQFEIFEQAGQLIGRVRCTRRLDGTPQLPTGTALERLPHAPLPLRGATREACDASPGIDGDLDLDRAERRDSQPRCPRVRGPGEEDGDAIVRFEQKGHGRATLVLRKHGSQPELAPTGQHTRPAERVPQHPARGRTADLDRDEDSLRSGRGHDRPSHFHQISREEAPRGQNVRATCWQPIAATCVGHDGLVDDHAPGAVGQRRLDRAQPAPGTASVDHDDRAGRTRGELRTQRQLGNRDAIGREPVTVRPSCARRTRHQNRNAKTHDEGPSMWAATASASTMA
ncbi:hypothetical protein PSCLAVI8L_350035 [Pseudoclavibacter sp. 8L]|nr:hypothetical protein PSCLAVI8L_350035 [Pseudoclavibacter sp. 8L]